MKFRTDFVPSTFPEAVQELIRILEPHEKECFLSWDDEYVSGDALELEDFREILKSAWSLGEEGNPLTLDCQDRGLYGVPDEISYHILFYAWEEMQKLAKN